MSEVAKKVVSSADHRVQAKPFKPSLSSSSAAATTIKHQGLVKKEREPVSPPKHSLPKTSLHSTNHSKLATPIGKATSSKATPKSSSKYEADKKEKKVYTLPGQKHDPPDEREPLRIFYGSLYEQNPKSEMAQIWMMEHGLLPPEVAKKVLERKKKGQLNPKLGLSTKSSKSSVIVKHEKVKAKTMVVTPERKSFTSITPERKSFAAANGDSQELLKVKRKLELDSDSDDDRVLMPKKKLSSFAQPIGQFR